MTDVNQDWRELLSDPPKPRTFAELMRMIILMAVEDSETAEADYSPAVKHLSARAEFKDRVGYDIYEQALEFLDAPIFHMDTEGVVTTITQGEVLNQVEPRAALWVIPAELKMLRETLCLAQSGMRVAFDVSAGMRKGVQADEEIVKAFEAQLKHLARIDDLIAEIDRHRPLGPDGKHGDQHTPTCGCDTV